MRGGLGDGVRAIAYGESVGEDGAVLTAMLSYAWRVEARRRTRLRAVVDVVRSRPGDRRGRRRRGARHLAHRAVGVTGPSRAPAVGYRLVLPPGWMRLPVRDPATPDRVEARLREAAAGQPRDAVEPLLAEAARRVRDLLAEARAAGALDLYAPLLGVRGRPVPASFVVHDQAARRRAAGRFRRHRGGAGRDAACAPRGGAGGAGRRDRAALGGRVAGGARGRPARGQAGRGARAGAGRRAPLAVGRAHRGPPTAPARGSPTCSPTCSTRCSRPGAGTRASCSEGPPPRPIGRDRPVHRVLTGSSGSLSRCSTDVRGQAPTRGARRDRRDPRHLDPQRAQPTRAGDPADRAGHPRPPWQQPPPRGRRGGAGRRPGGRRRRRRVRRVVGRPGPRHHEDPWRRGPRPRRVRPARRGRPDGPRSRRPRRSRRVRPGRRGRPRAARRAWSCPTRTAPARTRSSCRPAP
nr:hypothetical protein [Angustibacter aerolatus]